MAVHITGGSLGFSLGPLLFAPVIERMGSRGRRVIALPGLAWLALTLRALPALERARTRRPRGGGFSALRPYARVLALLYAVVVLRTLASLSFATFVPVMLTRRGMSLERGGRAMVSLYLFASGIGGFVGGPLADRFGPRRVIAVSLAGRGARSSSSRPMLHGWAFVVVLAVGGLLPPVDAAGQRDLRASSSRRSARRPCRR